MRRHAMERVIENPDRVKKAEIVVGSPSYKEADSIGYVVGKVDEGLTKYFWRKEAVILNVDNNSPDGTKDAFFSTPTKTPKLYISTPPGVKGKGRNIRNLFEAGVELGAEVIIMVDADLKSITPQWMQYLAEPIYLGNDYVIPIYVRHKYDGTITNNITYPLTRVLYGLRTRQPIAGDFAFSGRLARAYLTEKTWDENVYEFGIDIWMTTIAINEGFKICQSFLGAKIHDAKDPAQSLGPMFKQVVGTLFYLMTQYEDNWKNIKGSYPTAMYGFRCEVFPKPVAVKLESMIEKFKIGVMENKNYWYSFLPKKRVEKIEEIAHLPQEKFNFPVDLWVKVVYDFAIAYKNNKQDASSSQDEIDKLVGSLVPLYFGRTASFVKETYHMSDYEAEEITEKLCNEFEKMKPYLIERWFK